MTSINTLFHTETHHTKFLWFLMIAYSMILLLANWFDLGAIHIYIFYVYAGTIIFSLVFPLSALIAEVYGYKHARRAIWCGLLFNIVFILLSQMIVHMPSPAYATNNPLFDPLLTAQPRVTISGLISYIISLPLNIFLLAKQKSKLQGNAIYIRFLSCCSIAITVDCFVFTTLTYYGTMSNTNLLLDILNSLLIKIFIVLICIPVTVQVAKKLKTFERLDIYDHEINFNPFRLEAEYPLINNNFDQH